MRMHSALFLGVMVALTALAARAASPQLLEHAVDQWLGERDHWAFTQRAVEPDRGRPRERLERYDPSQPGNRRWQLLAIDGQPPTDAQRTAWEKRKFRKKPRRFDSPLGEYFDFERAKIAEETASLVRYQVPLRLDKSWLFPVEKVDVIVSVNKETRALEHLAAHVREPFRVLLGLGRVMGGKVDLDFLRFDPDEAAESAPENAQPSGSARVTVSRMGERIDFTWSDFKRVTPHPDRQAEAGVREEPAEKRQAE